MARITDRLVVQRVDGQIVVMDDSSGAEIVFPVEVVPNVLAALNYLVKDTASLLPRDTMEQVVELLEAEKPDLKVVAVLSGTPETALAVNLWTSFEGPDSEQEAAHLLGHAVLELMEEEPVDGRG